MNQPELPPTRSASPEWQVPRIPRKYVKRGLILVGVGALAVAGVIGYVNYAKRSGTEPPGAGLVGPDAQSALPSGSGGGGEGVDGIGCWDANHTLYVGRGTPTPYTNRPQEGVTVVCLGDSRWDVHQRLADGSDYHVIYQAPMWPTPAGR